MTTVDIAASDSPPGTVWRQDAYSEALRTGHGPLFLRRGDGWLLPLDVERWCGSADATDHDVLRRCRGPVLDIGCGPGRFVAALRRGGHRVLGIDINPVAVERTVDGGGPAAQLSVFEPLPGEGGWGPALLMDGNLGIGGDPESLLRRIAELITTGGRLIVEVAAVDVDERLRVHIDNGQGLRGTAFPWARMGALALARLAPRTGWRVAQHWATDARAFTALHRTA